MREDRGRRRGLVTAALAIAIPLVVGACGSTTTANAPASTARTSATAGASATAAASTAGVVTSGAAASSAATSAAVRNGLTTIVATAAILQFKAPLLAGGALDGTTYTGKPVAFWFWAPW